MPNHPDLTREAPAAERRIKNYIRETPLEFSPYLSALGRCNVYLKLENLQKTGSFKYRGAANHILSLFPDDRDRGLVTASTGNHAAAVACVLDEIGSHGTVYLPENTSKAKLEGLRVSGMELKFHGTDCIQAEIFARKTAQASGQVYIPPYNHPRIIAGQATVAIELERQLGRIDVVFVPVGGGGLMSGIAGYLKGSNPSLVAVGCQPENSSVMYESVRRGKIVDMDSLPTLSDGTSGGIEKDSLTFEICRRCVDDYVLVSEDEIKNALILLIEKHNMLVEGAAALSVASFIKLRDRFKDKNVVLVISGNKISLETLRTVIGTGE